MNHNINLQIWHGASVSTHNILKGKISTGGGVESNWDKDENVINKKLKQLPDDKFGLLICWEYHLGTFVLPEWSAKIPNNKAIAKLYHTKYGNEIQNECILYHPDNFKYFDLAKEIISALRFTIIATNI